MWYRISSELNHGKKQKQKKGSSGVLKPLLSYASLNLKLSQDCNFNCFCVSLHLRRKLWFPRSDMSLISILHLLLSISSPTITTPQNPFSTLSSSPPLHSSSFVAPLRFSTTNHTLSSPLALLLKLLLWKVPRTLWRIFATSTTSHNF